MICNLQSDFTIRHHTRILIALIVTVLFPAPAFAQDLIQPDDLIGLDVTTPTEVVAYANESPLQFGHLYLPQGAGPHPVIAFIHGGCYLSMFDIEHSRPLTADLADRGYAVWSIEYRRVGDDGGGWPNTFLDVAAGLDHLRVLAEREDVHLDLDRVYAMGHSAGANMALWAAARGQIDSESDVYSSDPLPIAGVLGLAPAPTLGQLHASGVCGNVLDQLLGGSPEDVPERYDAISPMRLMLENVPQRLVLGALDGWRPSGRAYYEAASDAGLAPVDVVSAPESGHFEMIAPFTTTWPLVLEELARLIR